MSKTRKVQSAVDSLVLTTLSIDPMVGRGGDPNELALAVATYFGVTLDVGDVRLAIENHLKAGRLQIDRTITPPRIILSADVKASLSERIEASQALEEKVRREWLALSDVSETGLSEDKLWAALQNYLGLVFNQHGAEAVQLLDSRSDSTEDRGTLPKLLDDAIARAALSPSREKARTAIRAFFTAPSPSRIRYMSELLDGTFTFFALSVSDSTAEYLKGQVPSLKLFLDTNVVLAVLGLQDNPLQQADVELLDFIKSEHYPFKLYYHERTLREILEILDVARANLTKRHFTPALSQAYLQYMESRGVGFGLERQFHSMNANREIDAEAFLARYDHVEDMLRDRGIQRYNQSGADLNTERKGELIAEFDHYLKNRRRVSKAPRRYEALDHDVTVWMFLQRQRSKSTNALRSGALLLSNDYSLHSFDRSFLQSSAEGKRVATVVLPHHLLQVLRPFSRVTVDFDRKFMEIFAAPEFRTTQTDYGKTASKVLSYLASFEGVARETAVHILNDDLLMGRLTDVESTDESFGELIENAVLTENGALVKSVSEKSERLAEARQAAEEAAEAARAARAAREFSDKRARDIQEAAKVAAERAVQELEAAKQKEVEEAEARRAADQRAEREARAHAQLGQDLQEERRKREAAEASVLRLRRLWGRFRVVLAWVFSVLAALLIIWGPGRFGWSWLLKHEGHLGMQALAVAVIGGLGYLAGGGSKHRGAVATAIVVGGLLTLLSLL
ncbi:cell envelope integrity protein TolA [Terrabacter terrae]|uniref:cell envelope integrity protein TolA n=1 Tax=Terrabacter terrae TaxID=318434 RepID=UPI0031E345AF